MAMAKYMAVTCNPKVIANRPIIIGFSRGLANRNTIMVPKPACAFSKPLRKGMVEQEQNGVMAPSRAAVI